MLVLGYTKAVWVKGEHRVSGRWKYCWSIDRFHIALDEPDPLTGERRDFYVCGDHPWFNGFRIVEGQEDE
jgi:hypothetical protein